MARVFDKNMFIMLLSIMVGVIIITFFIADIMRKGQIEDIEQRHIEEIQDIENKNINFSSSFLDSIILINKAQDYRTDGEINYHLAKGFYKTILNEINESNFNGFKNSILNNCSEGITNFNYAYQNFNGSIENFVKTKNYTNYNLYKDLCSIYSNYSRSGADLSKVSLKLTKYLMYLTENLTFENGSTGFDKNISELYDLYNLTYDEYLDLIEKYGFLKELLELFDLYVPER